MSGAFRIVVDDAKTQDALKSVRRDLNGQMRKALREVAAAALPIAREAIRNHELGSKLRPGSTSRAAYVSASGKRYNRWLGISEYGGTRRDVIKPVNAKALHFGGGFAANVSTPRQYHRTLEVTDAFKTREGVFAKDIERSLRPLFARIGTVTET